MKIYEELMATIELPQIPYVKDNSFCLATMISQSDRVYEVYSVGVCIHAKKEA